jgi:hypothetical protein
MKRVYEGQPFSTGYFRSVTHFNHKYTKPVSEQLCNSLGTDNTENPGGNARIPPHISEGRSSRLINLPA